MLGRINSETHSNKTNEAQKQNHESSPTEVIHQVQGGLNKVNC